MSLNALCMWEHGEGCEEVCKNKKGTERGWGLASKISHTHEEVSPRPVNENYIEDHGTAQWGHSEGSQLRLWSAIPSG